MNCEQARPLLHAYLDDELDLTAALQIETHLENCPQCRNELAAARAIQSTAAQPAVYHPASPEFRDRLIRTLRSETARTQPIPAATLLSAWWKKPMAFSGLAAMLLLIAGSLLLLSSPGGPSLQVDELVGSHLRSLEANHLLDVESTDQHTVKPWFDGKLDFAPPVIDLSAEGFPLIGGRLDYLNQKKVAALIFHRNKHVINLFIWPGDASPETSSRQGFNLIRFECMSMTCWAVSDLNADELQTFVDLFKTQKPASTRS